MKKIVIDLFSDTNYELSPAMRQAMYQAEVGNEVAGEDPTVNRLLEAVCDLLGKECGLFMPSGTMCNGVAYRVWGGLRKRNLKHAKPISATVEA